MDPHATVPRATKAPQKDDKILQNTNDGYVETDVKDIPLSDAAGEGRTRAQ